MICTRCKGRAYFDGDEVVCINCGHRLTGYCDKESEMQTRIGVLQLYSAKAGGARDVAFTDDRIRIRD